MSRKNEIIDKVLEICEEACPDKKHLFKQRLEQDLPEDDRGKKQKIGMAKKASSGQHVSRIPFGYKWSDEEKEMVPAGNYREVEDIFHGFLEQGSNLSKVAKKHGFSVNGLKKILRNFAYVGKVRFDGQLHEGNHRAIIDSTTFNKVQDKLDAIEKKSKKNTNENL